MKRAILQSLQTVHHSPQLFFEIFGEAHVGKTLYQYQRGGDKRHGHDLEVGSARGALGALRIFYQLRLVFRKIGSSTSYPQYKNATLFMSKTASVSSVDILIGYGVFS